MLKYYQNLIYNIIEKNGFAVTDFSLVKKVNSNFDIYEVICSNSKLWFDFKISNISNHKFNCVYTCFEKKFKQKLIEEWKTFEEISVLFQSWLKLHAKPLLEDKRLPDLWDQLISEESLVSSFSFEGTDVHFSNIEKKQISSKLILIQERIIEEFHPTSSQLKDVQSKIDYLIDALSKLSKRHWKDVLVSTIISIIITLSLDTKRGEILFNWFRDLFHSLIQIPG